LAISVSALAATSAAASVSPYPGLSGVSQICGPDARYSCTGGGYSGQSIRWPGAKYGAGQASANAYGYHNCTLYTAYRLDVNGVGDPGWSANAIDWDDLARSHGTPVNSSPAVGAIAQWNSGSFGHVAYVETVAPSYIELTDDNYGTNVTDRWRINVGSPAWPDNFLHFRDSAPPDIPPDVRVPVAGDFNGDGHQDLLASVKRADAAPNLLGFLSSGAWLGGSTLWSAPGSLRWADAKLVAADINGDRKSDLVAIQPQADGRPVISWLRSQGSSFAVPETAGVPGLWFNDVKTWTSGDFTGDGRADLLAVSRRSDSAPNLVVLSSTGSGLSGASLWSAPGPLNWSSVVTVPTDLDGDGKSDLLAVQPDQNGNPAIYWLRSTGSSFASPQLVGVPGLNFSTVSAWLGGDFTGDGHGDLLAVSKRSDSAPNLVVLGSTGGWLGGAVLWSAPAQITWATTRPVPADLDGDGKSDLLAVQPDQNGNPAIYWLRSTGSSFASPQLVGVPALAFGDSRWQS
jgi:hypothetical protein